MLKERIMKHAKKNQETKVYGRNACLKVFEKRREDIVRAYVNQDGVFLYKDLMKFLADQKLAYHIVNNDEIEGITKATHHEGICLIVKNKELPELKTLLHANPYRTLILALEEVSNPHNLGAIMRSAAHFGISGIIYEAKVPVANSGAAMRTAEGGAEVVPAIQVTDWAHVLDLAKRNNFKTLATSSHDGESIFDFEFPEKAILFLGAEGEGLSNSMMKKMNKLLSIPGTGEVESLNVSNATTAILTEWFRQGL